jgi:hypothetical protein
MPEFLVSMSERLVESVTLAALEAYVLGDGRPGRHRGSAVETFGYVWGYAKPDEDGAVIYLDRMSLSLSSQREGAAVTPNRHAAELKCNLMERWSPHLSLIGDFHTHPYASLPEVQENRGWEFSDADVAAFDGDDFLWGKAGGHPVAVVVAVCRLRRVPETFGATTIGDAVESFDVGEFRFWIGVNVGYLDEGGRRRQTFVDGTGVVLDLGNRFSNVAGDRIARHVR